MPAAAAARAKAGAAAADPDADGRKRRPPDVSAAMRHEAPTATTAAAASGGTETPETGTPPPRSLSPSSDGDTSVTPSEQHREGGANPTGNNAAFTIANANGADADDCTSAAAAIDVAVGGAVGDHAGITAATTDRKNAGITAAATTEAVTEVTPTAQEAVVAKSQAFSFSEGAAPQRAPEAEGEQAEDNASLFNSLSLEPRRRQQGLPNSEVAGDGNEKDAVSTARVVPAAVDALASSTTGGGTGSRGKASGRGASGGASVGDVGGAAAPTAAMAAATRTASTVSAVLSDAKPSDDKPPHDARGGSVLTATKLEMAIPATPHAGSHVFFSDHRIIEVLAAQKSTHKRLLWTAKRVPEILLDPEEPKLCQSCELYGSLALELFGNDAGSSRQWQDWAPYYINSRSDVDFVVGLRKEAKPVDVARRLLKGSWRSVGEVRVYKFSSTQYTLLGCFKEEGDDTEVYLDITCIESQLHFSRFKQRQEAFRQVFADLRRCMEVQFAGLGTLAFDAYIHLLKAFAAKVSGNALTGFQATCIGLFTLRTGFFSVKPTQSLALSLFEGFLKFCFLFFSDAPRPPWHNYRYFSIDLSFGGCWMPRMNSRWRTELYFMACETRMHTRPDERVNVLHSLDPIRVSTEAHALLSRAFTSVLEWGQVLHTIPAIAAAVR